MKEFYLEVELMSLKSVKNTKRIKRIYHKMNYLLICDI